MDLSLSPVTWNIFIDFAKQLKQGTLLRVKIFSDLSLQSASPSIYKNSLLQRGSMSFKHISLQNKFQESS